MLKKGAFVLYQSAPEEEQCVALITRVWEDEGLYGLYVFADEFGPTRARAVSPDLITAIHSGMEDEISLSVIVELSSRVVLLERRLDAVEQSMTLDKTADSQDQVVSEEPEPEPVGVESTHSKRRGKTWPPS